MGVCKHPSEAGLGRLGSAMAGLGRLGNDWAREAASGSLAVWDGWAGEAGLGRQGLGRQGWVSGEWLGELAEEWDEAGLL